MFIQIAAGAGALAAANTHKDAPELGPIEVNGALLVFDFGENATLDTARESIRSMDAFVGGLIADADENDDILALSALKGFICASEREVEREFAYILNASATSEANDDDAGSRLHAKQHASINESPSSNQAVENEELNTNGEAQQKPRNRKVG